MTTGPFPPSPLSPESHEVQYNPQAAFPDFKSAQALRAPANARALERLTRRAELAYGGHPLRKVDVYPAADAGATAAGAGATAAGASAAGPGGAGSPVHLFFHGGYWRAQDKENFAFIAAPLVQAGITTVIVNYELCPASTLDAVVDSALASVAWTYHHIAAYGGDPDRITLSGHSAGAHLVAECLACDWQALDVPAAALAGAVMISGIYDPAPAIETSVNRELKLTAADALRRNVERRPVRVKCPVALFAGGREPWRWIEQTFRYAHHLHRSGVIAEVHTLPRWGHFDILHEFMEADAPILRAVLAQAASGPRR